MPIRVPSLNAGDCWCRDLALGRCGALSGGQARRVQHALAICGRPTPLVLDEPTAAMDPASRKALRATVRCRTALVTAMLQALRAVRPAGNQGGDRRIVSAAAHGSSSLSCATDRNRHQLPLRLPGNELCDQRRVCNDESATEHHRILDEPGRCLAEASHGQFARGEPGAG